MKLTAKLLKKMIKEEMDERDTKKNKMEDSKNIKK